jgi:hypothetical protein
VTKRRVGWWKFTDIPKEPAAFIIRVDVYPSSQMGEALDFCTTWVRFSQIILEYSQVFSHRYENLKSHIRINHPLTTPSTVMASAVCAVSTSITLLLRRTAKATEDNGQLPRPAAALCLSSLLTKVSSVSFLPWTALY